MIRKPLILLSERLISHVNADQHQRNENKINPLANLSSHTHCRAAG